MPVCLHCDVRASEKRSEDPALRLGLGYVVSRVSHEGQATLARIDMPLNLRLQREGEANVLLQRIYWRMHNASLRWEARKRRTIVVGVGFSSRRVASQCPVWERLRVSAT